MSNITDRRETEGNLFAAQSAIISPCGRYRYRLERQCPGDGCTLVIMVNPSTADAETDDATIRKLKGFGSRHNWGRLLVGNLFAYRATDVRELATADDPVGPINDVYLQGMVNEAERVIVAWGPVSKVPPRLRGRWLNVWGEMPMTKPVLSIGPSAKCGHPKHPLMLGYDSPIVPWYPSGEMVSAADASFTPTRNMRRLGEVEGRAVRAAIAKQRGLAKPDAQPSSDSSQ